MCVLLYKQARFVVKSRQYPLTIDEQFRGPPESGHGGYVSGAIAARVHDLQSVPGEDSGNNRDSAIEVTLRSPIPLNTPLLLVESEGEASDSDLSVWHDALLIAEARQTSLSLSIPQPPSFAEVLSARENSPSFIPGINPLIEGGLGFHPICFCCGADVPQSQGLHVYAAPVPGFDGVAAAWRPDESFATTDGIIPEAIVWAALDCPGQISYFATGLRTGLLGRMTGRQLKPVVAGQDSIIVGWCLEVERRKHFAGTALFDQSGDLCAYSKQVWIGRVD